MDLEEVYLRQIDHKFKQNNELQEEANKILREILKELRNKQKGFLNETIHRWNF